MSCSTARAPQQGQAFRHHLEVPATIGIMRRSLLEVSEKRSSSRSPSGPVVFGIYGREWRTTSSFQGWPFRFRFVGTSRHESRGFSIKPSTCGGPRAGHSVWSSKSHRVPPEKHLSKTKRMFAARGEGSRARARIFWPSFHAITLAICFADAFFFVSPPKCRGGAEGGLCGRLFASRGDIAGPYHLGRRRSHANQRLSNGFWRSIDSTVGLFRATDRSSRGSSPIRVGTRAISRTPWNGRVCSCARV